MDDREKMSSDFVQRKIISFTKRSNEPEIRATLAKLRRGVGKAPGSIPELWEVTMKGLPEPLLGKGNIPTFGEWAVHTALTLYALHQQGKDLQKKPMNCDGVPLGFAIRQLVKGDEDEPRIKRRFDAVATSDNLGEFSYHLRGLIQLLKTEDIPLDYPALTKDLYRFQVAEVKDSVRLQWGRDFYRSTKLDINGETDNRKDKKQNENK